MGDVGVDRESSSPSSVHVCVPPVVVSYVEGKGCMNCCEEDEEYEYGGEDEEDGGDEEDEGAGEGKGLVNIGVEADVDAPMEEVGDGKSRRVEWARKESVSLETSVVGVLCILNVGVTIIPPPPEGEGKVADLPGRVVVVVVVPPANQLVLVLVNAEPTPTALNVNTGLCSLPCPEVALLAVDVGVGLPAGDDSNDPELDWDIQEVVMCG